MSSPQDLNSLDYWFRETLKARVFHVDSYKTVDELKTNVSYKFSRFTTKGFFIAINNLLKRFHYLSNVEGDHLEQLV